MRTHRTHASRPAVLILTVSLTIVGGTIGYAAQAPPSPDSAFPRSRATLSALIGTWEIVEFSRRAKDGEITMPFGSDAVGRITYDANGNVTTLLMHEQRNEAEGRLSSPEVQAEFTAYFGTYSVDTERRIIIHHVSGSLSAERASGELRRNYEFRDGSLILTFTRTQDGATNTLIWKRVSHSNP